MIFHNTTARSKHHFAFTYTASSANAYTIIELLVVVAILGILSSIAITYSAFEIQRARINSIQLSLAGWLQSIQRAALEKKSTTISSAGCSVSFNDLTNQTNGAIIASVTPVSCSPTPDLIINVPSLGNELVSSSSSLASITFTPRGSTIYPSQTSQASFLEYRLRTSGSTRLRCVRVSDLIGVIEIGSRSSSTSLTNSCTDFSRI